MVIVLIYTMFVKYFTGLAGKYLDTNIRISDQRNKHLKAGLLGIKSVKFNGLEPVVKE